MSSVAILFSNIHDREIPELTQNRSVASIPFAGRYRLVDFALSNLVNSNIYNVNLITHYNYYSLIEHLGSGKDWDLARTIGGLKILSPFMSGNSIAKQDLYDTRLEALKSIVNTINDFTEDYVILSDSNMVCNIDLDDIVKYHKAHDADMTAVVKTVSITKESARSSVIVKSDEMRNLIDIKTNLYDYTGKAQVYMNIAVFKRTYFQNVINDAVAHNYKSMTFDIIDRNIRNSHFVVYNYDGYIAPISSLNDYYQTSMDMIQSTKHRKEVFLDRLRPILTRVRNSAPTYYGKEANVKNSIIADGCKIYGTVENSVIFRGVKIGKNTVVKNSIVFRNSIIGENVVLNCVLSDIGVTISDNRVLSGCEISPYYIGKNKKL